jgi:hypothetical protein
MHQPKIGMHEIVIKVGTHPWLDHQTKLLAGSVASHRIRIARFFGAKDYDQSLADPIFQRNLPCVVFFGNFGIG